MTRTVFDSPEQLNVGNREEFLAHATQQRFRKAERANTLTHGVGLVLAIVGAVILMLRSLTRGDGWLILGCSVFSASLISVYAASTLSHAFGQPRLRRLFRTLDQGLIYFLIVGTYTPLALIYLRRDWWPLFLAVMWIVALMGFFSKTLFLHRVDAATVWSYLVLGWMPVASAPALVAVMPVTASWLMIAGGLCYTVGAAFLVHDARYCHFHAIWHLSVIAGSTCHFCAIWLVT